MTADGMVSGRCTCGAGFRYVRYAKKRTRCPACTQEANREAGARFRERMKLRAMAIEAEYPVRILKEYASLENTIERVFNRIELLPEALQAKLIASMAGESILRLPIDAVDETSPPRLIPSMEPAE